MFHFKTLFFHKHPLPIVTKIHNSRHINTLYKQHTLPKPFRNITIRNYPK